MVSSRNGEVYSKNSFTLKSCDKNKKSDMGSAASILNQNEKKRTRFGLVLNKNEQLLVFNFQN